MSTVVIWNSEAGQKVPNPGQAAMTRERLAELLSAAGVEAPVWPSDGGEQTRTLADRALAEGFKTIVAAGGDGTIGNVAGRLLGREATLGILPLGSVMNVPRSLGISRDLDEAIALLARRPVRRMDVGLAAGQPFYEAASVGMSVSLFRAAEKAEAGDYPSVLRTIWLALRYRPARITLTLDGRQLRTRALMVTISNGPYTGLGLTVAPGARLDDGHFDVGIFSGFSKFELLRHLVSIAFGRRRYAPQVTTHRAANVRIEASRALPCRADGRELGATPLDCEVLPGALAVVADPAEAPEPAS
jgi:diacylglycerol kinase (ATP)